MAKDATGREYILSGTIFSERKILKHLPTLNKYLSGEDYPPILVELDLTNKCTSDCPWCFGFLDRKLKSFTLFETDPSENPEVRFQRSMAGCNRLIEELAHIGVKAVTFTGGGDPTCHKGLFDLLGLSHQKGLRVGLITNGVIDVCRALPFVQWVRFSVDAATEETYGLVQHGTPESPRKNHFKIVLDNIKAACAEKLKQNLSTTIGVGFLTNKASKREIIDFARLWQGVDGLDYIQYRPTLDCYGEKWFSDTVETMQLIREAQSIDPRVVYSEAKYHAFMRGERGQTELCHGIFMETAIAADGNVYVCCHLKGMPQYSLGSLYQESFQTIWKRHLAKRRFVVNKDCPAFCRHFGTNQFIEDEILAPRDHEDFI